MGWIKRKKADDMASRGTARWLGGFLEIIPSDPTMPKEEKIFAAGMWPAHHEVRDFVSQPLRDSGQSGFLRYPLPNQGVGPVFTALARMGAGMGSR